METNELHDDHLCLGCRSECDCPALLPEDCEWCDDCCEPDEDDFDDESPYERLIRQGYD